MTPEDRSRIIAELAEQRADVLQKLSRLESLIEFVRSENPEVTGTQSQSHNGTHESPLTSIYSGAKTLAELSKICLQSVNGAGLTPKEIGDRLIDAKVVQSPHGLTGHIITALKRRIGSVLSPEREIVCEQGRYYYRPAKPSNP